MCSVVFGICLEKNKRIFEDHSGAGLQGWRVGGMKLVLVFTVSFNVFLNIWIFCSHIYWQIGKLLFYKTLINTFDFPFARKVLGFCCCLAFCDSYVGVDNLSTTSSCLV